MLKAWLSSLAHLSIENAVAKEIHLEEAFFSIIKSENEVLFSIKLKKYKFSTVSAIFKYTNVFYFIFINYGSQHTFFVRK